jgi:ABC-2 type transport system permease protein
VVATVLRLRYRLLGNMLTRSPWQLVGFVFGAVGAAGGLLVVVAALVLIGQSGLDAVHSVVTLGGALLVVGWSIAPLLAGGVDTTIEAEQLAPFPLTTRQVMLALTLVGVCGIPGIVTTLGALIGLVASGSWPGAPLATIVCLPLGVLTCVVASRAVASFSSRGRGRLGNVLGLIGFGALVLAGPIVTGLLSVLDERSGLDADSVGALIDGLSWTPVGAVWAVPGELVDGDLAAGLLKLVIAIATLAALWLLWRRNVVAASVSPRRRVASARSGRLGWIRLAPTGAVAAGWARSLHYWLGDPRYLRNLVIVAVLPVLLAFALGWQVQTPIFAFVVVLPALLLGLVPYADVSYDGTAFSTVLAAGIRGRDDRTGRLLGALTATAPLVVLVTIATVGLAGEWMLLPAVLGCGLGALLVGLGICAISSAYLVIPVPASGDNVFKRVPGQSFWVGLALMGFTLLAGALTGPALALAIVAAVSGAALWSWLALAVGLLIGVGVTVAGVAVGGRAFDRTGPLLLERVRTTSGY